MTVFQRVGCSADLIVKLELYPTGYLVEHEDRVEYLPDLSLASALDCERFVLVAYVDFWIAWLPQLNHKRHKYPNL
jgi:hypothetical protein